jgi:hypothetical protein
VPHQITKLSNVSGTKEWARATLEACLAILTSAREQRDVLLHHQVPVKSPRERP